MFGVISKHRRKILLILVFYSLALLIAPVQVKQLTLNVLWLPWGIFLYYGFALPHIIAHEDGQYLIPIIMTGFIISCLLRWRFPEQARFVIYYLPIIYFMMGLAYWEIFYSNASNHSFFQFYILFSLCVVPSLVGIIIGKWLRYYINKNNLRR